MWQKRVPVCVPVFNHDNDAGPALGQIIGGHAFPAFVSLTLGQGQVDDCIGQ